VQFVARKRCVGEAGLKEKKEEKMSKREKIFEVLTICHLIELSVVSLMVCILFPENDASERRA